MANSPYTPEFKAMISQEYLDGKATTSELEKKYHINNNTIRRWALRYKEHGIKAFIKTKGHVTYSEDFKIKCVDTYILGEMSVDEIVAKYNISSQSLLRYWISLYNANRKPKEYILKREVYMAKARKTTFEERKEIVTYCLEHNRNYKKTAIIFDVSYNQVYTWVKKYDTDGEEGLIDKRGHHKTDEEVDEIERLRRENKRLKRQLEESDMLVQLLKKVKEFEGM